MSESLQKYGVPFYSAAWFPYKQVRSKLKSQSDDDHPDEYYVVLAGGGGEGRSGIPNAVVLSRFDFASNSLSSQPEAKFGIGSDLPYRMAVHPGGDGVICALPNSCRFYEWDEVEEDEVHKLGIKESDKVLTQLEDVGQQLALAFNSDSSLLAVGGEDGKLRVFKWPSMEIILNEAEAHTSVKDLCFSLDGKFLATLGGGGPGRIWDVTSSTAVSSLSKENGERFASCRFSQSSSQTQVLYIAAMTEKGGSIITWDASSWKRTRSKHVTRDGIASFDVSPDGKFLAVGLSEGNVLLIKSSNMQIQTVVKKAHIGIVTSVAFSHDSRALVSASMDSSARVTLVEDKKTGGSSLWLIILVILLAIAAFFMMNEGLLPTFG
ncbi:SEC12-like protein 2 [Mercurialis annua]|uniref:SEC12-like protein 2 n=1 Tax=Mercurialis annua TaxID=3986 RepID=UPI002160AF0A|nr:SEC12-like protein 2 [Mercurialis annua]